MRCLYIVAQDPISPNYVGGASSMYYDQLLALSDLGHEIHLWHFASEDGRKRFNSFVESEARTWSTVKRCCRSVHLSEYQTAETLVSRGLSRMRSLLPPGLPVHRWRLHKILQELVHRIQPDFIWAQHFEPALLAGQQAHVPVVYIHHDWLYRIKALRNHRDINLKQKVCEVRLVRTVAAVVSGSATECDEIKAAGARHAHYIPVSFEPVQVDLRSSASHGARIVHLGGMGTTANREGLLAFFEEVWPKLKHLNLQFHVIGDTSAATPRLQGYLQAATCTGFVRDLTKLLRPYDIHIIPWQHSTGQRTRLPLAFNYGQVVVATKAAVACYPQARDGENCRLVAHLGDMVHVITQLANTLEDRERLGRAARATFEKCFVRKALLPRYAKVTSCLN